jgi:hypothetical protein
MGKIDTALPQGDDAPAIRAPGGTLVRGVCKAAPASGPVSQDSTDPGPGPGGAAQAPGADLASRRPGDGRCCGPGPHEAPIGVSPCR